MDKFDVLDTNGVKCGVRFEFKSDVFNSNLELAEVVSPSWGPDKTVNGHVAFISTFSSFISLDNDAIDDLILELTAIKEKKYCPFKIGDEVKVVSGWNVGFIGVVRLVSAGCVFLEENSGDYHWCTDLQFNK